MHPLTSTSAESGMTGRRLEPATTTTAPVRSGWRSPDCHHRPRSRQVYGARRA